MRGSQANPSAQTIGTMVCYFATLLFVTGDLIVNVSIIFAICRALIGCSIVSIVLAETLNGLGMVSANEGEFFRGAPILLYMWLLERLRFVMDSCEDCKTGLIEPLESLCLLLDCCWFNSDFPGI